MNWRARDWFFSRRIQTSAMDRFCWDCLRRNLVTTSPKCVTHAPSKLTSPSLRDVTLFDIERCWDTLTDTDKVWKGHLETLGDNGRQWETMEDNGRQWETMRDKKRQGETLRNFEFEKVWLTNQRTELILEMVSHLKTLYILLVSINFFICKLAFYIDSLSSNLIF